MSEISAPAGPLALVDDVPPALPGDHVPPAFDALPSAPPRGGRVGALLRRHLGFAVVLLAGVVIRVLVCVAYPRGFVYTDSYAFLDQSSGWHPSPRQQFGYSLILKILRPTHSVWWVSIPQHLLGLGLAVAGYLLLQRRGVRRWLSVLAVAPVLLDPSQITLEHYVLAETLVTSLLTAALFALLWPARPGTAAATVAGLLIAAAAATRVVALPVAVLIVGWMLLRRVGWRPLAAFGLCVAVPMLGYVVWYHHYWDRYGFSAWQGHFLYGRTAQVVDCGHIDLTARQRTLCPTEPLGQRHARADEYIYPDNRPASPYRSPKDDAFLQSFAIAVIEQQPGRVATAVVADSAKFLVPYQIKGFELSCLDGDWVLPARPSTSWDWCAANTAETFAGTRDPASLPRPTALTRALGSYSTWARTPHLFLGGSVLLVLLAALWRPRRGDRREIPDLLLVGAAGLSLIVVAVATSMYDTRYGVPSLAILPLAGVLALTRLAKVGRQY